MKFAFVVPRYGTEVVGGAELGARMLAERLVSMLEWEVEVFTTCALDHMTWDDSYPAGTTTLNGVVVHRFSSEAGRAPGFNDYSGPLLQSPGTATPEQSRTWINMQGPVCPDVIDAAEASDASVVAFYPYLYFPTVYGIPRLGRRAVMHPAAHDEPPIRLPLFREVFGSTAGFVFQTLGERAFVHELFSVAQAPQVLVGLGIETHPGDPSAAAVALGFDTGKQGRPYLCCLGRVDDMKGCRTLAEMFIEYKRRHPSSLALAFVGPVFNEPPEHPDIIVTGMVDEGAKWGILEGALALVSPSPHEAFSLVVIEGWIAGAPVLVNGACDATREHCEMSGGGLWFGGPGSRDAYEDFDAAIQFFESGDSRVPLRTTRRGPRGAATLPSRSEMVHLGRTYAEDRFRWPVVIDRYSKFLLAMADRAAN